MGNFPPMDRLAYGKHYGGRHETRRNLMQDLAEFHRFKSPLGEHLFVTDGSRLYDMPSGVPFDSQTAKALMNCISLGSGRRIDGTPLAPPPLQTLSLNVAQACNMGCSYCYAGQGAFGGKPRLMQFAVAKASVDRLILESAPGADLVIGFMGGEPFVNRALLQSIMPYAHDAARAAGRTMRFSLTTNATLLQPSDALLLSQYRTHVAVSIDGPKKINDGARPMNGGGSSYDLLIQGLKVLQAHGRPHHLSARITVTPASRDLPLILEHVLSLGFDSAGFSPVLVSPDPAQAFQPADFDWLLEGMMGCGQKAVASILEGRPYPFSNLETALQEIARGTHRPYPCGAGAAYLSVNAEGNLYACHRLVDDPTQQFGDVWKGSNVASRATHLAARHVDRQEPCRSCWARYLCGGGCYHEVDRRGRPGCDYIRGWLEYCLSAYMLIERQAPGYFSDPVRYFEAFRGDAVRLTPVELMGNHHVQ
jgi:uncharacterized protein